MGMNVCRGCGLTFGTLKSFETHRSGSYGEPIYRTSKTGTTRYVIGHTLPTRRCLTLAEIQALGMTQNAKGWWMFPASTKMPRVKTAHEQKETIP